MHVNKEIKKKIPAWARRGDELGPCSLATRPRQALLELNAIAVGHRRTRVGAGVRDTEGWACSGHQGSIKRSKAA